MFLEQGATPQHFLKWPQVMVELTLKDINMHSILTHLKYDLIFYFKTLTNVFVVIIVIIVGLLHFGLIILCINAYSISMRMK